MFDHELDLFWSLIVFAAVFCLVDPQVVTQGSKAIPPSAPAAGKKRSVRAGFRVFGFVLYGMLWYVKVWYGMVLFAMVWKGMVWYGIVWYGKVWCFKVWYGMV